MKNIFREKFLNILIFLFIIIIPIQTRYFLYIDKIDNIFFEYGSMAIYLIDIYLIIFIVYLVIYNLKNKLFKFNNKNKLFLLLLIFINIFFNLSLISSINENISIYFNIRFLILSIFIFLLSLTKINIDYLKNGFIYSSLIQGALAIYQFKNQYILSNKFLGLASHYPYDLGTSVIENMDGRFLRSYGLLPHPNILALFLFIGFTFLFFKILNNNKKNYSNYFFLGIIFIGILLTFSRSIIFILIIFLIILISNEIKKYFIDKKNNYEIIKKALIIFLIIFSNAFIFKELILTRTGNARLNNISNNERINQYLDSRDIIKNNFLIGVGERNYTLYSFNKNKNLNIYDLKPIHNIYILILCEIGIFGLISFLSIFLITFLIKFDKEIQILFFLILLSGIFDHFLLTENFGLFILMLFVGIIFSKNKQIKGV